MKKFLQKKLKNEKGLTLIELLAVIVILAIIAAIAIPAIGTIIENSRQGAVKSDYQNALASANIYFTENPEGNGDTVSPAAPVVTVEDLLDEGYLDDSGSLSDGVLITKITGGNTINGSASADGNTYTVVTLTNTQLGEISNSDFKSGINLDTTYIGTLD